MKTTSKTLFSTLVAALLLAGCHQGTEQQKAGPVYTRQPPSPQMAVYRIDILPQYNPAQLVRQYAPLIDYVNDHLGGKYMLEIGIPPDFKTFEKNLDSRAADFVLGNPWHTVHGIDKGYHVIATAGDASEFRGVFIVRKDSAIHTPADLKGKTVSYPSPTALAAGMMSQWFLETHGLDVMRDTKSLYVGSQESSIMSVYLHQSAAGATWPPPWRQFQADYPKEASEMTVIWTTPPLINNGVLARNDVPIEVEMQVQTVLTHMNDSFDGQMLLKNALTSRFYPATDHDYDSVRTFVDRFTKRVRPVELD